MNYAKIVNERLVYPHPEEFRGVPNWVTHEPLLRSRGYLPIVGEPDVNPGFTSEITEWHVVEKTKTHIEPRQVLVEDFIEDPETHEQKKTGQHYEMRDTEIVSDASYIQVDKYEYKPVPVPPPEPRPDTTDRDNAEKAIVGAIVALADKYNALEDLAAMEDITIPSLKALADSKGVPEEEYGALITLLTPYKWQLEAVTGLVWAECWEGLKSRFAQWMREINKG